MMPESKLKASLEAVKANKELRGRLAAAEDFEDIVAVASQEGFGISAEELRWAQTKVSEEELETLSGLGLTHTWGMCSTNKQHGCFLPPTAVICSGTKIQDHAKLNVAKSTPGKLIQSHQIY